jgi:uncharacterized repeat protein (TIGR04076 family)
MKRRRLGAVDEAGPELMYNAGTVRGDPVKTAPKAKGRNGLGRREFCRALGGAAFLGWPGLERMGIELPPVSPSVGHQEEGKMAKKIKEVRAKVISVKGTCGLGHKAGDIVRFTEGGVDGHICIHAMYSMLPKVFAMMFNASFPWAQNPDVLSHACPDAANPVVFELTRVYED